MWPLTWKTKFFKDYKTSLSQEAKIYWTVKCAVDIYFTWFKDWYKLVFSKNIDLKVFAKLFYVHHEYFIE